MKDFSWSFMAAIWRSFSRVVASICCISLRFLLPSVGDRACLYCGTHGQMTVKSAGRRAKLGMTGLPLVPGAPTGSDRQGMRLHTESQIVKMYGETEAKVVMANKEREGLTAKDPNHPGKLCYWMYSAEKEVLNTNRNSIWSAVKICMFRGIKRD